MTDTTALDELINAVEAGEPFANIDFYTPLDCLNDDFDLGLTARSAYNGSFDAAKALHDALLPGYGYGVGPWGARVWLYSDNPSWDGIMRFEVDLVDLPARAWLLAVLRAYRAQIGGAA